MSVSVTFNVGSDVQAAMTAAVAEATARATAAQPPALPPPTTTPPTTTTPPAAVAAASDETRRLEHWSLVQPIKFAALAGYGRDVARLLTASAALAHDPDLLYALQVPSRARVLAPHVTYKDAVVPLLHAAAAAGREERVRELLGAAAGDAHLLEKRDAKGRTPVIAAAAAGEPRALAALLADKRATRELVAAEGIEVSRVGGVPLTAFVAACDASNAEARHLGDLQSRAQAEVMRALFAPRAAGVPAPDVGATMTASYERLLSAALAAGGRRPTREGAAECARLLVASGAVDPAFKTGQGSAMQELAAAPARAAVIRGARPTQLSWCMDTSGVREAVGEALLADPRCTRNAVAAHWLMLRKSAFWNAVEAFGVLDRSDHGEPQPRFLAHDVAWWQATLAGGAEARAALSAEDRGRVDAYALIRRMTPFLRPSTVVLRRPAGPFYSSDGSDGPGHECTAEEVCEGVRLQEIAPIVWAPAPEAKAAAAGAV
jgi:hypothetical protein